MGLEGNVNGGKKFVTIVGGQFTIRSTEGAEGAVKRTLTAKGYEGKIVYELQFPRLRGKIAKMEFKKGNFGEVIEITVVDDHQYVLQVPWNSSLKGIITRLPNVSYKEEVVFSAFTNDKEQNVLLVYQGKGEDGKDKIVPSAYTKEAPNGMPAATETTVRGVKKWNFEDIEEFLYGVLQSEIQRAEAAQ